MEPLIRAILQVEKPGDKSFQIWVISPIPFCSTLCSNEASNFYIDLSKMFLGKIPSKWDTVCWNQCPISKVKNLTIKKFEGWISMKTAFLKAKADIYETGAKMSLTHHKQIHEIWPSSALIRYRAKNLVNTAFLPNHNNLVNHDHRLNVYPNNFSCHSLLQKLIHFY